MQESGMSPYQAPSNEGEVVSVGGKLSSIPKVMGILHIVFGSISLLLAIKGMLTPSSQSEQLKQQMQEQMGQDVVISADAMQAIESMNSYGVVSGVIGLLGALALIVAGIGLVKYQGWGRHVSNLYVLLSFIGKVIAGYIMVGPMSRFMGEMITAQADNDGPDPESLRAVIVGGMVLMLLVMSVYMIVSLILLNKRSVKESLS